MDNIFTFLDNYGAYGMEQLPFCDIDALIASHIAYMPFDGIISSDFNFNYTVGSALNIALSQKKLTDDTNKQLASVLCKCNRYKEMPIGCYSNVFDSDKGEQFCAVTVLMEKECLAVLFRGTDGTLVGWKEDFNMSFMPVVPSQKSAVKYLASVASKTFGAIRTIGHSKGGNLAIFAACFAPSASQSRIEKVYNIDGPGFAKETIAKPGFQAMLPKLYTYVPQTSVVGMLLEHDEKYVVVKSDAEGIMQHDIFSWETNDKNLVYLDSVDNESKYINRTLKNWLQGMTLEEREVFVDDLFSILSEAGIKSTKDITVDWPLKVEKALSSNKASDKNMRKMVSEVLLLLLKSASVSLPALSKAFLNQ